MSLKMQTTNPGSEMIVEKVCPVCKRVFVRSSVNWAFKLSVNGVRVDYCRWSCLQKAKTQKAIERKAKAATRRPKLTREERQEICDLIKAGYEDDYIAMKIKVSQRSITSYREKIKRGAEDEHSTK